ncbi:MAG: transcriptional repressor [Actinobacteria bacterium]|nr:transcriptional repressor [Actinomycetota bacterium]
MSFAPTSSTWAATTIDALRGAGFRTGGARRAVIELLARQTCCLSAQEIWDGLRRESRPVGIASVYRVLEVLADLKLVQRLDVGGGVARYEPMLPSGDHHHHLVCDDCGKVEAFSDEPLEDALRDLGDQAGYDVDAHDVVLRGSCGDCRV